jgi:hypothetical protein
LGDSVKLRLRSLHLDPRFFRGREVVAGCRVPERVIERQWPGVRTAQDDEMNVPGQVTWQQLRDGPNTRWPRILIEAIDDDDEMTIGFAVPGLGLVQQLREEQWPFGKGYLSFRPAAEQGR